MSSPGDSSAPEPRLAGDLAMWFIVAAEMLTFGVLFVVYAVARLRDPDTFAAGQATLDLRLGTINTVLLLTGSWCVARGIRSLQCGRRRAGALWTWTAVACGAGFLLSKASEYAHKHAQGVDLETDTFYTFYYVLTGFHFLHVAAAVLLLAAIAWLVPRKPWGPQDTHAPETAAVFWHMVDLLWIVLFALVYVIR